MIEGGDSNNNDSSINLNDTPTSKLAGTNVIVGLEDLQPLNIDGVGASVLITNNFDEV